MVKSNNVMANKINRITHSEHGLSEENRNMFVAIGLMLGCEKILAYGSRVRGNWVDVNRGDAETSDYDFVILDDVSKNMQYRAKVKEIEQKLNVKLDFQVNDKVKRDGVIVNVN